MGLLDILFNGQGLLGRNAGLGGGMLASSPARPRPVLDWAGDRSNALMALGSGLLSQPTFAGGLSAGFGAVPQGRQMDRQRTQKKALDQYAQDPSVAKAYSPAQLKFIQALPPDLQAKYLGQALFPENASTGVDWQNFQRLKAEQPSLTWGDYLDKYGSQARSPETTYGTPIFRYDDKNNVVGYDLFTNRGKIQHYDAGGNFVGESSATAGQTAPGGQPPPSGSGIPGAPAQSPAPGAVRPPGSIKLAPQGTSLGVITPSGAQVGTLPVDNAGKARDTTIGGGAGTAAVNLPLTENIIRRGTEALDDLVSDKDLESLIGYYEPFGIPKDGAPAPNPEMRKAQEKARAKISFVLGNVFATAFESLKGAGAITEQEGAAAKAAITKLQSTRMNYQDYLVAAQEAKREFAALLEVARKKAAMGGGGGPAATVPAQGGVVDYTEFFK